jgi:hypothetical protein
LVDVPVDRFIIAREVDPSNIPAPVKFKAKLHFRIKVPPVQVKLEENPPVVVTFFEVPLSSNEAVLPAPAVVKHLTVSPFTNEAGAFSIKIVMCN